MRGAEVVLGVVSGLAIKQIAEGALHLLHDQWPQLSAEAVVLDAAAAFLLVVTVVRFFHGNTSYLRRNYYRWHHAEVHDGSLFVKPVAHAWDVLWQMLEYLALVAAGYFLAVDGSLRLTVWAVVALFGIDVFWTGWILIGAARNGQLARHRTERNWFIQQGVSIPVLMGGMRLSLSVGGVERPAHVVILVAVLFLGLLIDYAVNFPHYFRTTSQVDSCSVTQANWVVQVLSGLDEMVEVKSGNDRMAVETICRRTFAGFMGNIANRKQIFQRDAAHLHVGIYLERGGYLTPLFRLHDPKIRPGHTKFPIGRHYIGTAYRDLPPGRAIIHHKPDKDLQDRGGSKYYNSSVLTPFWWPAANGQKEPLGIVVLTASKEDYFTPELHEAFLVGLATKLTQALTASLGKCTPEEAKQRLLKLCDDPIIVSTAEEEPK